MISVPPTDSRDPFLSIGIFAWNEERAIAATLDSLFQQTLLGELSKLGKTCEIICVTNGCTDKTVEIAQCIFEHHKQFHLYCHCFEGRVVRIRERGKINAWNQYVHALSSRKARYLFMMDADIVIHLNGTIWNMVEALQENPQAVVAVDRPCKDLSFKRRKTPRDRFSIVASKMTSAAEAQLCGQLYCIRAESARTIYLPKDLAACEDGILKALVCTDNLAHEVWPTRICIAEGAAHTFEAYTSPSSILKNQKRQIIGQTIVHILVDKELPPLAADRGHSLAEILRERDALDPGWLRRRVEKHLQETRFFWNLHPGLLSRRFRHLRRFKLRQRAMYFLAAICSSTATFISSFFAYRTLKAGCIAYWPKAARTGLGVGKVTELGIPVGNHKPL